MSLRDFVRTFFAPGSGKRRKGKKPVSAVSASVYQPYQLDMEEVAGVLMEGLARSGVEIFRAPPQPRRVPVRVTATLPMKAQEIHPLARNAKQLLRPEEMDRTSPALFRLSGERGLRVTLDTPVRMPERPAYPPRPLTPPPVPAPRSEAHSELNTMPPVEDTQELYQGPGWDALFTAQTVFGADTLDMPEFSDLRQQAHVCKHCGKFSNGLTMGARVWRCETCKVIAQY